MSDAIAYDPLQVESRWRQRWKDERCFETPRPKSSGGSCYVYAAPPFTTGLLHLGHVRSYTIADACARYLRAQGAAVLFSIGFDSFGLPNELAAAENQLPPRKWVERCQHDMTAQFERLGCSFDWSRAYDSSREDLYRWSQWVFLKFLENDLVYRADGFEHWCPHCQTVLAALQVIDNRCWRCEQETQYVEISQWYLRLSAFAEELDSSLDDLDGWDNTMLKEQRALLGRVEGFELDLEAENGDRLSVFISDPHALSEACFVAISADHPFCKHWRKRSNSDNDWALFRRSNWSRLERSAEVLPLLDLGLRVGLPGVNQTLPVVVTPSVAHYYGGSAVFGIPSQHRSDRLIAQRLSYETPWNHTGAASCLRRAVRYRCRDFSISRQRFWGAPIPIVYCPSCGLVPVAESDLPIKLPNQIIPTGQGNPLAKSAEFTSCKCPKCGLAAERETDTLDSHMDALWHIVPPCVDPDERIANVFINPELGRWLPAHQIICGGDQAKYMLSYRFFFMAMSRCGLLQHLPHGTPAKNLLMHGMVLAGHKKMSKHLGNVVNPDDLIEQWGADALRWCVLDAANPRKDFHWTAAGIPKARRFLDGLWEFVTSRSETIRPIEVPHASEIDGTSPLRAKLRKWHAAALTRTTLSFDRLQFNMATRNLSTLLQRLKEFDRLACQTGTKLDQLDRDAMTVVVRTMLRLIEPLTPHLAEELWMLCGGETPLRLVNWPEQPPLF